MEKLLNLAAKAVDQAEVFYQDESSDQLSFNDGKLEKADTSMTAGIALRVIKDGKMGLAHTRNLLNPEALLAQAMLSAQNGVEVDIQLPHTTGLPEINSYNPEIESLNKKDLIAEGNRIINYVKQKADAQVNLGFSFSTSNMGIMNSAGSRLSQKSSDFTVYAMMIFPGTGSGLFKFNLGKDYQVIPQADLDEMIELFLLSKTQIVPETKEMPVIFSEFAISALLSRFFAAIHPVNIYNKVSPLCNRIGEQVCSPKLSIWQDPFDTNILSAAAFDSEGTPTQKFAYLDKGVFTAIPTDLNYAHKLNLAPTGNGFRGSIEALPSAQPFSYSVGKGEHSLQEMISGIDKGLIVHGLMGAHSGNILNGDYSVGVSTGFYIENGVIQGRVKDCMLSGNAWDSLNKIGAIENKLHNLGSHMLPSILFDGISVAGK